MARPKLSPAGQKTKQETETFDAAYYERARTRVASPEDTARLAQRGLFLQGPPVIVDLWLLHERDHLRELVNRDDLAQRVLRSLRPFKEASREHASEPVVPIETKGSRQSSGSPT